MNVLTENDGDVRRREPQRDLRSDFAPISDFKMSWNIFRKSNEKEEQVQEDEEMRRASFYKRSRDKYKEMKIQKGFTNEK
jgi:purine-nucleoside phosphorylase